MREFGGDVGEDAVPASFLSPPPDLRPDSKPPKIFMLNTANIVSLKHHVSSKLAIYLVPDWTLFIIGPLTKNLQ